MRLLKSLVAMAVAVLVVAAGVLCGLSYLVYDGTPRTADIVVCVKRTNSYIMLPNGSALYREHVVHAADGHDYRMDAGDQLYAQMQSGHAYRITIRNARLASPERWPTILSVQEMTNAEDSAGTC